MIQATALPSQVRPNASNLKKDDHAPRTGLMAAVIDSKHNVSVNVGGRTYPMILSVKNRANYPRAKVKVFCMHPSCASKTWDTVGQMAEDHPGETDMKRRGEAHVYAGWSDDVANPMPDPNCPACTPKPAEGKKAGEPKACADHNGGVIGLVSVGDA